MIMRRIMRRTAVVKCSSVRSTEAAREIRMSPRGPLADIWNVSSSGASSGKLGALADVLRPHVEHLVGEANPRLVELLLAAE